MKVFITGGSKGIGLESVIRFVDKGYQVITCSRDKEIWDSVVSQFPKLKDVDYHSIDISKQEQVVEVFKEIEKRHRKLDIAINNASPRISSEGKFQELKVEDMYDTLTSDLWSHALCLRFELPLMAKGGSIVNISSITGFRPTPGGAMYSAAKHGIEGLTSSISMEAIKENIRVNAVAPGVTWTPRWEEKERAQPGIKKSVESKVPIQRFASVEEVVNAIEWLTSKQASYVVGHTLVVDGGLSLA